MITQGQWTVKRRIIAANLLMILVLAAGCAASNLDQVHQTYREEFATNVIGLAETKNDTGPKIQRTNLFPKTLSAIQHFQAKYPDKTNVLKHLAVLQAMVYLQSRQYGMARLALESDAVEKGKLETSNGELLRDELFYQALTAKADDGTPAGLIEAWESIDRKLRRRDPKGLSKIGDTLSKLASKAVQQKKVAQGDDGAIYIAATAATCYFHAADVARRLWRPPPDLSADKKKRQRRRQGLPYYKEAMKTLDPHLSVEEKIADRNELAKLAKGWARYDYIHRYHVAKSLIEELE